MKFTAGVPITSVMFAPVTGHFAQVEQPTAVWTHGRWWLVGFVKNIGFSAEASKDYVASYEARGNGLP